MSFDLSILIPASSGVGMGELWLGKTVEDILEHSGDRTEIIVALDGTWVVGDPIPVHERVSVIYLPEWIGQRAATNIAARLSSARWVMKCDAHCAFSDGFDEVLMGAMEGHDDWTIVPTMYNLHVFDWVCERCRAAAVDPDSYVPRYQGPTIPPGRTEPGCLECGTVEHRELVWHAKPSPETTAMRFNRDLQFKYWGEFKQRQVWKDDVADTMSLLGACWMLTRERYWELNICDEAHGGWGQQGTEVACKTWLSGGRLVCHRGCWFGHMFRTQGDDFGFTHPTGGRAQERARAYSRAQFANGEWQGAKHPLDWLIKRFAPVPDWPDEPGAPTKGIVYYTTNKIPLKTLARPVRNTIRAPGLSIYSASLKPMPWFGTNVVVKREPGPLTMFMQILSALELAVEDYVFFCEHDVLYHRSHFDFVPPRDDVYYYNMNVWKVAPDGRAVRVDECCQTSGLCASRELLLEHYRKRVEIVEANPVIARGWRGQWWRDGFSWRMGFEPGTHKRAERVDDFGWEPWSSEFPNIDIRHDDTLTGNRWKQDEFRVNKYAAGWTEATVDDIPGWDDLRSIVTKVPAGHLTYDR